MDNPDVIQNVGTSSELKPAIQWGWLRALLQLIAWFIVYSLITGLASVVVILIQGQDPATLMADQAAVIEKIGIIGMVDPRIMVPLTLK